MELCQKLVLSTQKDEINLFESKGLANSPTKLPLKNLLKTYTYDFCIIVEPWIDPKNLCFKAFVILGI